MMRWYPQLGRSVVYPLNTSKEHPRRFFLYNHKMDVVEREFDTSDDCAGCFDLSPDGKLIAVKYWHRKQIDIIDTATGDTRISCGPSRVSEVKFDATASKLLVKADSGLFLCTLAPPFPQLKIGHAKEICRGCSVLSGNEYVLPSRQKGKVILIRFDKGEFEQKNIGLGFTVKCIRMSPATNTLILLDSSGTLSSYNLTLEKLLWQAAIKPVPSDGQILDAAFSGNGQLIGLTVVHDNGSNTITLDSKDGTIANTFIGVSPGCYPFDAHSTLSACGEVLDLTTGNASETFTRLVDY